MIDVLTVLLIFLILSFAADQTNPELAHGKNLPQTESAETSTPALTLSIHSKGLTFNNQRFSTFEELDGYLGKIGLAPQQLLISVDRDQAYESVDKIVARFTRAGFTEFNFLAEQIEENGK